MRINTLTAIIVVLGLTLIRSPGGASCPASFFFARTWGTTGSSAGAFDTPVAIEVDRDGNVHVVDRDNRRVQKFTAAGDFVLEYGNEAGRVIDNPNGIGLGPRGYLYVADTDQHRVLYYSDSGAEVGAWYDRDGNDVWNMLDPWGVAGWETSGGEDSVYVIDRDACKIMRFSGDGRFIDEWGHCGAQDYLLATPQDVATYLDDSVSPPDIDLYVADTGNDRIKQFTHRLEQVRTWGRPGTGAGEFQSPGSVATDDQRCVYVADTGNHRIQVFDAAGSFVTAFGVSGAGPGELDSPRGVAVDAAGCVYVADTGNDRVAVFCPTSLLVEKVYVPVVLR